MTQDDGKDKDPWEFNRAVHARAAKADAAFAEARAAAGGMFQSAIEYVEAIEWRGSNVEELQRWLAPASPLIDGGAHGTNDSTDAVQVIVLHRENMQRYGSLGRLTRVVAVRVGDWLVRRRPRTTLAEDQVVDPADIEVVGKEEFARRYVAVGNYRSVPAGEYRPGDTFAIGGPVGATHPRVGPGGAGCLPTSSQIADLSTRDEGNGQLKD